MAAPLPDAARQAVERIAAVVRRAEPDGQRGVRWVRFDGLHVTLRFLGPMAEPRIAEVLAACRDVAAAAVPFRAGLGGAGAFPTMSRPRALWLDIEIGAEELAALAAQIDGALAVRGWTFEPRPFRAHLTLARSDGVASGPETARRLVEAASGASVDWDADRIVVFESITGGGPARYVPIETFTLARR